MRIANVLWFGLILAACGDDKAKPSERVFPGTGSSKSVEDLLEAQRNKLHGLSSRPLTSDDVDNFIAIFPAVRNARGNPTALKSAIEGRGADPMEWYPIQARIMGAYSRLQMAEMTKKPVPEAARADTDFLRPYLDRIKVAMSVK